jgi:hypothetical protein
VVNNIGTEFVRVIKATDPTSSWTEQDSSNAPAAPINYSANPGCISSVMDGNTLHAVVRDDVGIVYVQFDCATDTWTTTSSESAAAAQGSNPPDKQWCSLAVRSDGDVIVAYNGITDRVMGGDKERVDYSRREGGSWTRDIALDAAGDIHYGNVNVVRGVNNDEMHFVWQRTQITVNDPPIAWADAEGRTLDSGNNLSTTVGGANWNAGDTGAVLLGIQNLVSWNDGTDDVIGWHSYTDNANRDNFIRVPEDGSGDLSVTDTVYANIFTHGTNASPDWVSPDDYPIAIVLDPATDILWSVFSGGVDPNTSDRDIYYSSSDDDGATWATPVEHLDAVTCNFISANIYVRGSDTVLAYTYDDGGTTKYNEVVIAFGNKSASGGATLAPITASGNAVHAIDASGAATLAPATASGAATVRKKASGAATLAPVTAAGTASRVTPSEQASGAATLAAAVAAATAKRAVKARGESGTFTHKGAVQNGGTGAGGPGEPFITHGITINAGDLVVAYVNANHEGSISADEAGWTEAVNERPDISETCRQGLYWKVAGVSEPDTYNWTTGGNDWRIILKVFSVTGTPTVDLAAVTNYESGSVDVIECLAPVGRSINAGSLSIVAGGKDNRFGNNAITTATDSYVNAVGNFDNQVTGMAHRIYATADTGAQVDLGPGALADASYSVHITFVISGGPVLAPIEASGTAVRQLDIPTATGAATLAPAIASGTATVVSKASGDATLAAATASGIAKQRRIASGAATLAATTATGTAKRVLKASGAATLATITASGAATRRKTASGAATLAAITAAGVAAVVSAASGVATLAPATAAGTAERIAGGEQANGAATLAPITASGAVVGHANSSGNATLAAATASGAATVTANASGAATLAPITASGSALRITDFPSAIGAATLAPANATGTATVHANASGGSTLSAVTASGAATVVRKASGAATLTPITAAGTATRVLDIPTASGAATLAAATASGIAKIRSIASGASDLAPITASGTAERQIAVETASGAATLASTTASGVANVASKASGGATLTPALASGSASIVRKASGAITLTPIFASGSAIRVSDFPVAVGNATLIPATASGTAVRRKTATGAGTLTPPVAAGSTRLIHKATGEVTLAPSFAFGSTRLIHNATGEVTLTPIFASGSGRLRKLASGAADIPLPVADATVIVGGTTIRYEYSVTGYVIDHSVDGSWCVNFDMIGYVLDRY